MALKIYAHPNTSETENITPYSKKDFAHPHG